MFFSSHLLVDNIFIENESVNSEWSDAKQDLFRLFEEISLYCKRQSIQ